MFLNYFICFFINHDFFDLFECITLSSWSLSLEEIKLIVTFNWIFHVPDFLRLFIISFKYDLISLRYFFDWWCISTVTPKIIWFYWFIIIFYFMIKKISNIRIQLIFSCFSPKRFVISVIATSSVLFIIFFQSLKISSIFNYVFVCIFFLQILKFSSLCVVKNVHYFFKQIKVYYTPYKAS